MYDMIIIMIQYVGRIILYVVVQYHTVSLSGLNTVITTR
jgi:hypothetical protein